MSRNRPDGRAGPPAPVFRALTADPSPRLHWLWPQRIPLGCLTLLIGDPAVGKSLLTADLAARLTVPHCWPDDPPAAQPAPAALSSPPPELAEAAVPGSFPITRGFLSRELPPAAVVFAAPEDDAAIHDRLTAAGANLLRVSVLDGVRRPFADEILPLRLPAHADQLEQAIRAHDHPRLVVLDPIHALLDDGVFSSADLQAGLLGRLAATARDCGVAILAVGHFSKSPARRIFYRIRGSLSLVAAARSILALTADPDCPDRRILTQVKNAYGHLAPPLAFRIVAGPRLAWDDPARPDWRLSTGVLDISPESFTVLSETCDWLADFLSAGPRPALDVIAAARAAGFPRRTLFRAKRLLKVASRKDGSTWTWLSTPLPSREGHGEG
jgi:hypothetical protein